MEIKIVKNVLEANEALAGEIRKRNRAKGITMFNFMSSPGSGKTAIIERIVPELKKRGYRIGIVEGDITSTLDAERVRRFDVPISQINTEPFGGDCHLGSEVILPAIDELGEDLDIILIENVGNLVCPAEFDTGADHNIVVLSITEGEDKPLKYPLMFRVCSLALVNKIDLLPYLDVNIAKVEENIRRINSNMYVIKTSAKTGEGVDSLVGWMERNLIEK
ncbi:MAG: hydrogenase accessory protein HypB [Candidatus Neomarinimicrobiota bacterium]|nr:MAG: hydrogenase accessory protein HypB [Candidatus Neomarinimicrobiota bacterium]RKY49621.1 MAG: hydrogenase accessory protein HypB [Candidatus Neomarinimicrobiota bacterium]